MSFNSDTLIISIPRQPIVFFVHIPLWWVLREEGCKPLDHQRGSVYMLEYCSFGV
jgi:hypothetical protein